MRGSKWEHRELATKNFICYLLEFAEFAAFLFFTFVWAMPGIKGFTTTKGPCVYATACESGDQSAAMTAVGFVSLKLALSITDLDQIFTLPSSAPRISLKLIRFLNKFSNLTCQYACTVLADFWYQNIWFVRIHRFFEAPHCTDHYDFSLKLESILKFDVFDAINRYH